MSVSDETLIQQYLEGETSALKALIERYTDIIYNYVNRTGGGASSADIVQDIFISVWKELKRFDSDKATFKTWLFRIARNKTIDTLRKKKSLVFSDLPTDETQESIEERIEDTAPLPDSMLQKNIDTERLQQILNTLPEEYRTVITLHYENDMTFEAISESMHKPANTVKSWHRRAIIALRSKLHQDLSD